MHAAAISGGCISSAVLSVPKRTPSVSEGPQRYAGAGESRSLTLPVLLGALRGCLILPLCLLLGCQAVGPRAATTQPAVPVEGNAALTEYIADQPFVTVEPAYRAVYVLRHGEVFEGDFAALTDVLRDSRIIGSGWNRRPDALIDRASIGYMFCRACNVRSGVNWHLTGLGRYAWRELIYLGIAGPVSEWGYVPGGEFVGMLSRAEDYLHGRGPTSIERASLGTPP